MSGFGRLTKAPLSRKLETLEGAMEASQKQPWFGITQGGSSGKNSGARVAARDANTQRQQPTTKRS